MPDALPALTAKWIWHPPREQMDNFHLLVRRVLSLSACPAAAVVHVSANSIYELYVNGHRVGRGPSPSSENYQYIDTYDVASHLRNGDNIIAARCYNFGPTMQSILGQDPGPGAFLLQLDMDGETALVTDESWRVLQDPARRQQTEPISGHRGGFKEFCDGNKAVQGWRDADFDESDWLAAHVVDPPWRELLPREIPPLRLETVAPRDAFYHTCGNTYGAGRFDVMDIEALCPAAGTMTRLADDYAPTAVDDAGSACTTIKPLRDDFAPSIMLDFGVSRYGYFQIDIEQSQGGMIELSYGESLNLTLVDRYVMRPGAQSYQSFERRGGRYLMLTFRGCPGPVKLRRVVCYNQSYPVEPRGSFECDDERLNGIWQVGAYTVRMCMQDHYEDCPWREQTLYCGDLAVSAKLSYYAFGVRDLARKCLRQMARIQQPDGEIRAMGPAENLRDRGTLPEYPAFWVIALHDYHMHWNDVQLVRELWPNVERCMRWYMDHRDERGLFDRYGPRKWNAFIDNQSNITATDKLAAEELITAYAARCAASMTDAGDEYRQFADSLNQTVEQLFWDDTRGCLIDSVAEGGDTVTQITNGLAILFDALQRRVDLPEVAVRAGYMNFYVIESLIHRGEYEHALRRIRDYWGGMIDRGATTFWEVFDPDTPDGAMPQRLWSLCHAFCAGPVYTLPARFGGITPLTPGFAQARIAPQLGDLQWLRAAVPTPYGVIAVACRRGETRLTLPAGVGATYIAPGSGAVTDIPMQSRDQELTLA